MKSENFDFSVFEYDNLKRILVEGSESLLIEVDDDVVNEAVLYIQSMQSDLKKIIQMPLKDVEICRSPQSLSLKELREFISHKE